MPSWIYALPALFFFISGLIKYAKSGGEKIVMLGDLLISLGFLYQLVFPSQVIGFFIAAIGVIVDLVIFSIVAKNTRERQREEQQEEDQSE